MLDDISGEFDPINDADSNYGRVIGIKVASRTNPAIAEDMDVSPEEKAPVQMLYDVDGPQPTDAKYASWKQAAKYDQGMKKGNTLAEQILVTAQPSMSGIFHSHEWLAEQFEPFSVDGICFHGVKSCRTTSTGLPDTREWLFKNMDMPGLFIQSDLVDSRLWAEAQLKNRVDAFFESLESRRVLAGR